MCRSVWRQDAARLREAEQVLAPLVESYGVSGMEAPVREAVRRLLPGWARTQTDTAGNLWLTMGRGEPTTVFVAHLDEIGFRITGVRADGTLDAEAVGGLFPSLWEGQPALVHTGAAAVPAVFVPRDSAAVPPAAGSAPTVRVDVGTADRAGTEALGVRVGHTVTSPKRYVRLLGPRATGRSFDDRVGSTALVLAARRLDPARLRHTVIFIWSVREEIGLEGAKAAAAALGMRPARVHAIDTFVSADAPLERRNFAVAPLGAGPVARALDNSCRHAAGLRRLALGAGAGAAHSAADRHHQRRQRRLRVQRLGRAGRADRLAAPLFALARGSGRSARRRRPGRHRRGGRVRLVKEETSHQLHPSFWV